MILSRGAKGDEGAPGAGGVNAVLSGVTGDLRTLFRWGTLLSLTLPSLLLATMSTPAMPRRVPRMMTDPETGPKRKWGHRPGTVSSIAYREPRGLFREELTA